VLGTEEDQHNVIRAIARTVVSAQYEVARRRVAEGMRSDNADRLDTDEAILTEAVRATANRR
jgi:HD superfamily phosphodiesterase